MKRLLAVLALISLIAFPAFAQDITEAHQNTNTIQYYNTAIPVMSAYPVDFASTTFASFTFSALVATTAKVHPTPPAGTKRVAVFFDGSVANPVYWGPSTVTTTNGFPLSTASNTPTWFAAPDASDFEELYFVRTAVTSTPSVRFLYFNR
jgi:hypothetical protein